MVFLMSETLVYPELDDGKWSIHGVQKTENGRTEFVKVDSVP